MHPRLSILSSTDIPVCDEIKEQKKLHTMSEQMTFYFVTDRKPELAPTTDACHQ